MKSDPIKELDIEIKTYAPDEIMRYDSIYNKYIKRMLDILLAVVLLIVLLPFYVIIAGLVAIETGFPIIYRADRGGYNGKSFTIYKFRSMVNGADKMLGGGTTALNDPRVTKVGNFLRKTKLDEITQLFNIIKGDMSFIGPRPELLKYTSQYNEEEQIILKVRPGITDYSSLEFINQDEIVGEENAVENYEKFILKKKNKLRIKYAEDVSIRTDIYLFFHTAWSVVEKALKHIMKK